MLREKLQIHQVTQGFMFPKNRLSKQYRVILIYPDNGSSSEEVDDMDLESIPVCYSPFYGPRSMLQVKAVTETYGISLIYISTDESTTKPVHSHNYGP